MDTSIYPKDVLKIFETRPKLKKGLVSKNRELYVAHINKGEKKNYKRVSNHVINHMNELTLKFNLSILFPISAFENIYEDSIDCYVSYIKQFEEEKDLNLNLSKLIIGLYIPKGSKTESGVEVLEEIIIEKFVPLFSLESKICLKALDFNLYLQIKDCEKNFEQRLYSRTNERREYKLKQESYQKEELNIARKDFQKNFKSYVDKIIKIVLSKDKKFSKAVRAYSQNMFTVRVQTKFKDQLYEKGFNFNEVSLIIENWDKICKCVYSSGR